MKAIAVCAALFLNRNEAHSWTRCTDYKATINGLDYDEEQCEGWIRNWEFDNVPFGADRGVNYQVGIGGGGALCSGQGTLGSEDDNYGLRDDKATQYTPGSTVRLVWPAKNHANYECFANIPDTSMKLFMNPNKDPTSDLPNTASTMEGNGYVLVKDFQEGCEAGTDGCGFQNCRKFCENTGFATCFGDFVVPAVEESGWYTFVWYWIFNGGTAPYISCYEAYIDVDGEITTPDDTTTDTGVDGVVSDYITDIPVCVTGASYDSSVDQFAEDQFESVGDSVYILSQCDAADDNGFEITIQVKHSSPGADVTAIATDSFCSDFESEFGGSSCEISDDCGEITTFATYELPDTATPSPTEADVVEDAIQITNAGGSQAYYLPVILGDDCDGAVTGLQILKDGTYYDSDGYYYDGSNNVYQFQYNQQGNNFGEMVPITMRLVLSGGEVIVLEDLITDVNGGSVFTSAKTCDGTEISDDTPAPTLAEEASNICTSTPSIDDGGQSGAVRYGGFVGVCVLVLFWMA